ncbi:hypothetical protein [Rhodohalobacter halophilus]|uniref:hypothetical protein n=1 Tax=Rhodohalobacter halophilus TaxID=1812810 RepID=UPI00114C922E|nr:hypothetical protein [Rhodohalobacter halophilus]
MKHLILTLTLLLSSTTAIAQFQSEDIEISGYMQGMPVWINADLPPPFEKDSFWEYRLQNRLNVQWYLSPDLTFNWEMRTRLFAGDLVQDIPFYADAIDQDDGLVNLSWLIADREKWMLHYIPDRLNLDWYSGNWRITAGRQRVNWGINTITNPNDLFNIYSFYDFDYPERPGSDAVRVQYFLDWASRFELAYRSARDMKNSVAAILYGFNKSGYDIQMITGYYRHRWAIGGGWAGSIDQTGFKGEVMFFADLEDQPGQNPTNLIAALSADYMFDSSLFLIVEALYNKNGGQDDFLLFGEPLSADNPSFSRFQFSAQATYPFTPIWSGSLAAITYPDEEALFISPSVTWSALQDLDVNLLTQIFIGSADSVFSEAGNVIVGSIKWNF